MMIGFIVFIFILLILIICAAVMIYFLLKPRNKKTSVSSYGRPRIRIVSSSATEEEPDIEIIEFNIESADVNILEARSDELASFLMGKKTEEGQTLVFENIKLKVSKIIPEEGKIITANTKVSIV
ncbi:MAG: hypothetical protein ABIH00_06085 [Armatimonadota bacterium]